MRAILWFLRSKPNFIITRKKKEITLNKDDIFIQRNQKRIYSRGKWLACITKQKARAKKAFANKNGGYELSSKLFKKPSNGIQIIILKKYLPCCRYFCVKIQSTVQRNYPKWRSPYTYVYKLTVRSNFFKRTQLRIFRANFFKLGIENVKPTTQYAFVKH